MRFNAVAIALFAVTPYAFAQGPAGYPFVTPADPRSVAMGESFVGLPSDPTALLYNPAGLAGLSGVTVSYSRKSLEWEAKGWGLTSFNAVAATSFGVFAAQYNRNSFGTIPVTTEQFPDGTGAEITMYSHDVALGYAYRLPVGLALGFSVKYYDMVESYSGLILQPVSIPTSTPAYLFDFGLTYTLPSLHEQQTIEDSITVGLSYQNIGTQWKLTYPAYVTPVGIPGPSAQFYTQLPEYFRIGLSYAMSVRPAEGKTLSPFAAVLSGEFRSLQAPIPTSYTLYGSYAPLPETSYWGVGLEFTFFDILSIRGGASFRPFTDVEADRDKAAFRYGAGVHLPFQKIGVDIPLTFSIQYTVIPVSELIITDYIVPASGSPFFGDAGVNKGTFPVFSLEIQYTGSPW